MATTTPFAVETMMMRRHFDRMKPIWMHVTGPNMLITLMIGSLLLDDRLFLIGNISEKTDLQIILNCWLGKIQSN
jgi:hypothetical protein